MRKDQSEAQTSGGSASGASYPTEPETDTRLLREQARRCRRLADTLGDRATVASLQGMAEEYDARADALERTPHSSQ